MSRDFESLLPAELFWDQSTEEIFQARGEPVQDRAIQVRDEVIGLCEFIERKNVRSYLEIGIWTGRLVSTLHRIFDFELAAAVDHGWVENLGLEIRLHEGVRFLRSESRSDEYIAWRESLGPIDLVLIDADHRPHALRADFELNKRFDQRFIAFHDITGARRQTRGVATVWNEITGGFKYEIIRPHREIGRDDSTMGIGIWSETEDPNID